MRGRCGGDAGGKDNSVSVATARLGGGLKGCLLLSTGRSIFVAGGKGMITGLAGPRRSEMRMTGSLFKVLPGSTSLGRTGRRELNTG